MQKDNNKKEALEILAMAACGQKKARVTARELGIRIGGGISGGPLYGEPRMLSNKLEEEGEEGPGFVGA